MAAGSPRFAESPPDHDEVAPALTTAKVLPFSTGSADRRHSTGPSPAPIRPAARCGRLKSAESNGRELPLSL
jgi:hypothetical protein